MRNLALVIVALFIAGCTSSSITKTESPSVSTQEADKAAVDSTQQFLITAAASDFHNHGHSRIGGFREVHLKRLVSPSGEKTYMLCGQYLAEQQGGKAQWIHFVTIKTSGYEQYNGAQASAFCQEGLIISGKESDLSPLLQARFDALK